jgi:D-arabinose 1-dehydrogenase-like Zn-dependent alcohol dehydrogenase
MLDEHEALTDPICADCEHLLFSSDGLCEDCRREWPRICRRGYLIGYEDVVPVREAALAGESGPGLRPRTTGGAAG